MGMISARANSELLHQQRHMASQIVTNIGPVNGLGQHGLTSPSQWVKTFSLLAECCVWFIYQRIFIFVRSIISVLYAIHIPNSDIAQINP